MSDFDFSKKFDPDKIIELLKKAPTIAPELIDEIYTTLKNGGVEAVNTLFQTKGTFNPKFKDKKSILEYIIIMKNFSGITLDVNEKAV